MTTPLRRLFIDDGEDPRPPPDVRLYIAMLQRAIQDLLEYPEHNRHHRSARQWIFSISKEICSIRWVCEKTGIGEAEDVVRFIREVAADPIRAKTVLEAMRSRVVKHRPTKKGTRQQ